MTAVGVDGCRAGWLYVAWRDGQLVGDVAPDFATLLRAVPDAISVCVDIPIGLRDTSGEPRCCDVEARRLLGRGRSSCVFTPPLRSVLESPDHPSANALSRSLCGKGLSRQAFFISGKIREVDDALATSSWTRSTVSEIHPELCFDAFNGGRPLEQRKKGLPGYHERMAILDRLDAGYAVVADDLLVRFPRRTVARDDIADALVALATARLGPAGWRRLPEVPERDSRGLAMQMVCPACRSRTGG